MHVILMLWLKYIKSIVLSLTFFNFVVGKREKDSHFPKRGCGSKTWQIINPSLFGLTRTGINTILQQSRQKYKTGHHQGSLKRRRVDRHFYMASLGMNETMKILLLDDTYKFLK